MTQNKPKGILFLVPSPIDEENFLTYLPSEISATLNSITHFVVEDLKTARRFIKKIHREKNIDACTFYPLNEHSTNTNLQAPLDALLNGNNIALLSDAGCPGIADPGQPLVLAAHNNNICVNPLVGPSSIVLALMASGLNGQVFKFNGYLPKEQHPRKQKLRELETDSLKTGTTHIFIETPYRNNHVLHDILGVLRIETCLTIATEVKSPQQNIKTRTVGEWKTHTPNLDKQNVVFLIGQR